MEAMGLMAVPSVSHHGPDGSASVIKELLRQQDNGRGADHGRTKQRRRVGEAARGTLILRGKEAARKGIG
jgi:hypothetical protein